MTEIEEADRQQREWELWWLSLTPEQRAAEIRLMDAHVKYWEEHRGVFG